MSDNLQQATDSKPEKSVGKKALHAVIWVVAFVVASTVVKEIKGSWLESQAGDKANQAMTEFREKAVKESPDKAPAMAVFDEATKQMEAKLASQSGDKKAETAADQFTGFYLVNVRARHQFCKKLGIDITPFTKAFQKENAVAYAKSRAIHSRGPYTADQVEEKVYKMIEPSMQKTVQDDMQGIATQYKLTMEQTCQIFVDNGAEFAKEMNVANVQPALHKALMSAI